MGLTVMPIEVILFQVMVFVLKRVLAIASARVSIELTRDIGPVDLKWGGAGPMA
jgi:hypothetical protein